MLLALAGRADPVLAQDEAPNPWISVDYVRDNADAILAATRQHVTLTLVSVALGLLLAVPLALLARRFRRLEGPLIGVTGVIYTIPSLALFAVLMFVLCFTPAPIEPLQLLR